LRRCVSQSSLSIQKKCEAYPGVALLVRDHQSVALTEVGIEAVALAKVALEAARLIKDHAANKRDRVPATSLRGSDRARLSLVRTVLDIKDQSRVFVRPA